MSPDWTARILVTGGSGSGKSRHAEYLLAEAPRVLYVAPGPVPDPETDPEWAARVATHRLRRPAHWSTAETVDVVGALRGADGAVLVDCLGTWLTGWIDERGLWDVPAAQWREQFDAAVADLVDAFAGAEHAVVLVTNEVGWGLVSEHRSGRLFTALLGQVNTAVAAVADEVLLVVAGRPLRL